MGIYTIYFEKAPITCWSKD